MNKHNFRSFAHAFNAGIAFGLAINLLTEKSYNLISWNGQEELDRQLVDLRHSFHQIVDSNGSAIIDRLVTQLKSLEFNYEDHVEKVLLEFEERKREVAQGKFKIGDLIELECRFPSVEEYYNYKNSFSNLMTPPQKNAFMLGEHLATGIRVAVPLFKVVEEKITHTQNAVENTWFSELSGQKITIYSKRLTLNHCKENHFYPWKSTWKQKLLLMWKECYLKESNFHGCFLDCLEEYNADQRKTVLDNLIIQARIGLDKPELTASTPFSDRAGILDKVTRKIVIDGEVTQIAGQLEFQFVEELINAGTEGVTSRALTKKMSVVDFSKVRKKLPENINRLINVSKGPGARYRLQLD